MKKRRAVTNILVSREQDLLDQATLLALPHHSRIAPKLRHIKIQRTIDRNALHSLREETRPKSEATASSMWGDAKKKAPLFRTGLSYNPARPTFALLGLSSAPKA